MYLQIHLVFHLGVELVPEKSGPSTVVVERIETKIMPKNFLVCRQWSVSVY